MARRKPKVSPKVFPRDPFAHYNGEWELKLTFPSGRVQHCGFWLSRKEAQDVAKTWAKDRGAESYEVVPYVSPLTRVINYGRSR